MATASAPKAGGNDGAAEAAAVRYDHVSKRYPGQEKPAVQDLVLEVPAGEICVLVGPSGSGKTTAMRMVNRTVEITEGDILIGETSVRERDPAQLRREIGYVIQEVGLFPHRTVAANVATVPELLGWDRRAHRGAGRRSCSSWSASARTSPTATPPSSPAASSSGSGSRGRWPPTRR